MTIIEDVVTIEGVEIHFNLGSHGIYELALGTLDLPQPTVWLRGYQASGFTVIQSLVQEPLGHVLYH